MEAVPFRWNDDRGRLEGIDGYFIPGGFSYEDRGRAGMVAARDPLLEFIGKESAAGKVVIGNCNGAQVLVESGLIPLNTGLRMSLARNAVGDDAVGFLNEWIWMKPTCEADRCATSNWSEPMQIPIAHGEGRFTTQDGDLLNELKKNDQLAFSYCNKSGEVSEDPLVTPNGSIFAIAGICNPSGNVVAIMPHPERTPDGDPYFRSMRDWIVGKQDVQVSRGSTPLTTGRDVSTTPTSTEIRNIPTRESRPTEIFIDTIITNNEERTMEQAARRVLKDLTLKQLRYLSPSSKSVSEVLGDIATFNPNKEVAYVWTDGKMKKWNSESKSEEPLDHSPLSGIALLRRDTPDMGGAALGEGSETGICYVVAGIDEQKLYTNELLEVFANPHASSLERLKT